MKRVESNNSIQSSLSRNFITFLKNSSFRCPKLRIRKAVPNHFFVKYCAIALINWISVLEKVFWKSFVVRITQMLNEEDSSSISWLLASNATRKHLIFWYNSCLISKHSVPLQPQKLEYSSLKKLSYQIRNYTVYNIIYIQNTELFPNPPHA